MNWRGFCPVSYTHLKLLQYYRQLLKAHEEIVFKYRGNSTFNNVFRKEYESIIGYASLYHDEDHNLKRLKDLAYTLDVYKRQAVTCMSLPNPPSPT